MERCILPPLERPSLDEAVSETTETDASSATAVGVAVVAATAVDTETEHPVPEETENIKGVGCSEDIGVPDATSPINTVGARPSHRGSWGGAKGGWSRAFRRSRYNNINHNGIASGCQEPAVEASGNDTHAKHNNSYGRPGRRRRSSGAPEGEGSGAEGATSSGGYAPTGTARGCLAGFPAGAGGGGGRREYGGEGAGVTAVASWSASNLAAFSFEAMFAASPLLAALSLAGGLSPTPVMVKDGSFGVGGGGGGGNSRRGGSNNRSAAPALAADTSSLRTLRSLEEREAGRERQKLLNSLGVGTRRSLKRVPGKRGVQLVTTVVNSPRRPRPPQFQG